MFDNVIPFEKGLFIAETKYQYLPNNQYVALALKNVYINENLIDDKIFLEGFAEYDDKIYMMHSFVSNEELERKINNILNKELTFKSQECGIYKYSNFVIDVMVRVDEMSISKRQKINFKLEVIKSNIKNLNEVVINNDEIKIQQKSSMWKKFIKVFGY